MRAKMAETPGTEREVMRAFSDEIGAEVEGWDMRLSEVGDDTGE